MMFPIAILIGGYSNEFYFVFKDLYQLYYEIVINPQYFSNSNFVLDITAQKLLQINNEPKQRFNPSITQSSFIEKATQKV